MRTFRHPLPLAWVLLTSLLLQGCVLWPFGGSEARPEDPATNADLNATEQALYRSTQQSLRSGNYDAAIQGLEMLEARFPFGRYAEQAQLELVYARYMSYDLEAARIAADRFIRLHPQHPAVDYAYYLKGLAAFNRNSSMMDRLFATDIAKRDITSIREAYADFGQLIARFPDSTYAPDAHKRMLYLRNVLARSELHVADYYLRLGAFVAAQNRARFVIENYGKSNVVADALALSVEANVKMGLDSDANDALRVLALNFPNYPAFDPDGDLVLADAIKNRDRSFLNLMTLGLLDRPEIPPPIRIVSPRNEPAAAALQPRAPG